MSLIYDLNELYRSGLDVLQAAQRDWSPYLVHFTSGDDMSMVRSLLKSKLIDVHNIHDALVDADRSSFETFKKIVSSKKIESRTKIRCKKRLRHCVSLSECSFPGVISHSERYGRFGFMFDKYDIYKNGGRPCQYVDKDICREIGFISRESRAIGRMNGFANTYKPAPPKEVAIIDKPQDYTADREWRVMGDVDLGILKGVMCPYGYWEEVFDFVKNALGRGVPVYPLDVLYRWGV